jgi:hypothetical protein
MENETKAFCEPKLDASFLNDDHLPKILSVYHTCEKWAEVFNDLEQGVRPSSFGLSPKMETVQELEEDIEPNPLTVTQLDLKSPAKAAERTGIFSLFPTLSYEDDESDEISQEDVKVPKEDVLLAIKEFKLRFDRLKTKRSSAFQDVEVSHLLVTSDLAKVSSVTENLASAIGTPVDIEGVTYNSVWQAILQMSSRLQDSVTTLKDSIHNVSIDYNHLTSTQGTLNIQFQQTVASVQDTLKRHEIRFSKILPVLLNIQSTGPPSPNHLADDKQLEEKIHELSQAVEELKDKYWQSAFTATSTQPVSSLSVLDEKMRSIEAQFQALQMRIVGNGVQIGGVVFQCFEDVRIWVTAKFPTKRYGLFVDGVSLLDFSPLLRMWIRRNQCLHFIINKNQDSHLCTKPV